MQCRHFAARRQRFDGEGDEALAADAAPLLLLHGEQFLAFLGTAHGAPSTWVIAGVRQYNADRAGADDSDADG
jgi:hypothetical protein